MNYTISLFDCKSDNVPKVKRITWEDMIKKASRPAIRQAKDGQLMSGALFDVDAEAGQPRRRKALALESSMIFGDVDHGATFEDCWARAYDLECLALLYTTHSHRIPTDKNPKGEDRIRIVIPLASPVPVDRFDALWLWLQEALGGLLDRSCKDISRMVYTPAISRMGAAYNWAELPGDLVDWRDLNLERFECNESPPLSTRADVDLEGWEELRAELRNRIGSHPSSHKNSRGNIECRGICHNGKSNNALFINPEGVIWCNAGCSLKTVLRAFGLPDKPEPKIEVHNRELARVAGVVVVVDRNQAAHYAERLHCAAVALRRPLAYAGKKTVVSMLKEISQPRQVSIPITEVEHKDQQTMRGVRRLVGALKSLKIKVEVFEVKG